MVRNGKDLKVVEKANTVAATELDITANKNWTRTWPGIGKMLDDKDVFGGKNLLGNEN
jgi:hypothetical protein